MNIDRLELDIKQNRQVHSLYSHIPHLAQQKYIELPASGIGVVEPGAAAKRATTRWIPGALAGPSGIGKMYLGKRMDDGHQSLPPDQG